MLVEPQLGENIGMVARAMANFGLSDLRLVNPRDGWPNGRARAAASKADHVIDAVTVYPTLREAMAGLQFVVATTARQREMIKTVLGPGEAAQKLRALHEYGRSEPASCSGASGGGWKTTKLRSADAIVTFPVNPAFASLNIAQAVLLMSYEWMKTKPVELFGEEPLVPAPRSEVEGLVNHLIEALDEADYFHLPEKRERMQLNLKSILARAGFSAPEVQTLRGVVASLQRRWMRK